MSLAVVIPTCRPERMHSWVAAWKSLFEKHDVNLMIVEDSPATWKLLPDFIPQRTGSIRSWGFLNAYRQGYDVITLDDDCLPAPDTDPIAEFVWAFAHRYSVSDYFDVGHTFGLSEYMRGYPFNDRRQVHPILQYGGWDNVPDMDAITQSDHERFGPVQGFAFDRRVLSIPKGVGITGCIMNVAIKCDALPMMYQLVMGNERVGYDRWDDIWSGLFAKKICDHLGWPILINGRASIVHTRASDTAQNFAKEQGGYELNEVMWNNLRTVTLAANTIIGCYQELTEQLNPTWFGPHGHKIIDGMRGWIQAL